MKTVIVKASKLVFDYEIYPREKVDPFHINQMVEALKAGKELPPILVEDKTYRIVDGFHRTRAHQKHSGPDVKVKVEKKTYSSEMELFLESMVLNAGHGRALTLFDKARCIAKAESLGMEPEQVASALLMTPQKMSEMKQKRFAEFKMEPVILKGSASHMAGDNLTPEQVSYNERAGGLHQSFYVNQVIAMLETESVDTDNAKLMDRLRVLNELLNNYIGALV